MDKLANMTPRPSMILKRSTQAAQGVYFEDNTDNPGSGSQTAVLQDHYLARYDQNHMNNLEKGIQP